MLLTVLTTGLSIYFMPHSPRPECPRPDFSRKDWLSLNGVWDFSFQSVSLLERERTLNEFEARPEHAHKIYKINVPFTYESKLSLVNQPHVVCESLLYSRRFKLEKSWQGKEVLLHFGAVDYQAHIWLNDRYLGFHRGGQVPFSFLLGELNCSEEHLLTVAVFDPLTPSIPRGKQSWESPAACWYTPTSGIWQSVWLEAVGECYLSYYRSHVILKGSAKESRSALLYISVYPSHVTEGLRLNACLSFQGQIVAQKEDIASYPSSNLVFDLEDVQLWDLDNPQLYDLCLSLTRADASLCDQVFSYVGLRSVDLSHDRLLLNGQPLYQRLVLDQGYWADGRLTAPNDQAFQRDIALAKEMGFNGCRKHMKLEDPRFLYWADKMGFLVWSEFPAYYQDSADARLAFLHEWLEGVRRDINHPSIVAWTPFNESWGIAGIEHSSELRWWVKEVVKLTKTVDPSRAVNDNDGWEHAESDFYGYHSYAASKTELLEDHQRYLNNEKGLLSQRKLLQSEEKRLEHPLLISEFGGIGMIAENQTDDAWGYAGLTKNEEEFWRRLEEIFRGVYELKELAGFCYTQLSDVDQEINGLLNFDRSKKFDLKKIRSYVEGKFKKEK